MPSELEKMIERYTSELMQYQRTHGSSRTQPDPDTTAPTDIPQPQPIELPQPQPTSEQPEAPQMPIILPGEPMQAPAAEPPMDMPQPSVPESTQLIDLIETVMQSDIPVEPNDVTPPSVPRRLEQSVPDRADDEGYLQVRVSTANNALPIEGALVTVTDKNGALVAVMLSDDDGLTRAVGLPTVPRNESESPQYDCPYDTYDLDIRRRGYIDFRSENVPIFGGVTNVQNASLIPLPEFSSNGTDIAQNTEPFSR